MAGILFDYALIEFLHKWIFLSAFLHKEPDESGPII